MGQRHQVFLIAHVRPKDAEPTYRCVAAFHHQWCFGTIPLRAMYRFLRLVTHPENAAIVRTELREIDGKYGRARGDDNPMPPAPCPYSVSLLATAWTTNLDPKIGSPQYDGVTLRHAVLDAKMGCWDGDNNDGISVIDVTDPLHPAYCFMKGCLPLSAYEYLQEYYDMKVTNDEAEITMCLRAILRICGIPLITADVLKEAWPNESFQTRTPEEDHVNVPHDRARSLSASDYQLTVWYAVVSRLLEDTEDDEPLKWFATIGPAGPPATDRMKLESFLLRHPSVFNFRFVPMHVATDEQTPFLSLLPQPGASSANDHEMAAIGAAIEHVKTTLRQLSPFPDERLNTLVKIITLGRDRLADLSGFDLSAAQITSFVSQCLEIDALDISQNARLVLHDIPAILAASPRLLRLNVSGCSAIDGRALLELAIIHPAFLTIAKPPGFPVSFTFMFADRQDMNGVALPLYTPTQVLQALCLLLPLAWRSSESLFAADPGLFAHSDSGDDNVAPGVDTSDDEDGPNGHGGIGAGQTNTWKWVLDAHDRLNIPGSLAMSSPMLVYSAFSSGSQREDQSWSDRAVIGVPLHPYPVVSASPEGSWAFFLDWSTPGIGVQKWAFIRYAPDADDEEDKGQGSTPGERLDAMVEGAVAELAELSLDEKPPEVDPTSEPRNKRRGAVYDLRGFLRCMAEEGRPSPPEELVAKLEAVLYSRHQFNGALVCPLMQDEDVPTALTVIPAVAVGDVNGDIRTRRRYTLASEVHPLARFESGRRAGQ